MKNIFRNIKSIVASMAMVAMLATSAVSCQYDDTALWGEIDNIKKELAMLREQLETELYMLNEMVNGLVTVKEVKQQQDGSKLVTLSDGTKITIYPEGDKVPANLITTTTVDGVLCWAYYDGLGNPRAVVVNGKYVPVADLVPQTKEEDGAILVSFDGGYTWITTGYNESVADSIIKDIEIVYSDWQVDADGNPVALYSIIKFADGSTMKLGMQNGKLVMPFDSLFVPYAGEMPFVVEVDDAADFMTTTPKGWECEAELDAKGGRMYLKFFAPSYEAIESGAAVRSGVAKLMVVFNNGSSAIASIKLSTNPANTYFTQEGVYVEVGYGTNFLLCGIIPSASFKADTMLKNCNTVLGGGTSQYVYQLSFMESLTEFVAYSDMRTQAMEVGKEYTFWYIAPRTDENGDMYVDANELTTLTYVHSAVEFEVTSTSFFDVEIEFSAEGSNDYMLGYCLAEEFDAAALAEYYTENPDYLNATHQNKEYKGSFVELFDYSSTLLDYDTTYTAYFIAKSNNGVILVDNVYSWEFSTSAFTRDGDIEVQVVGEPAVEYDYIEMMLDTDKEHIMMFYNAMPSYMASAYPTDEYVIDMLMTEGVEVNSSDAVMARYDGCNPGDKLTFFAVAVDADGKIGKPFVQEYTTKELKYNDIVVTTELVSYKIDDTRIKVSADGAVSYRYIYTTTDSELWTERYGGSAAKAGEYILMRASASDVYDTADAKHALVDGCIALSGLEMDADYVLVVVAVDADGVVSRPVGCYFRPIANIGEVVYRTDANWETGKPSIEILSYEDNPHLFYSFSWKTIPAPHTTVYTAAMFRTNLINEELGTNIDTVEKLIAEIITSCDTGGMSEQGKSFEWQESGEYYREWKEWVDTNDDGYLDEIIKSEVLDGGYHFYPYGSSEITFIYTTWVGEDGNFHEPFAIDAITGEEVSLWE
ncbi:MAG: hypothetical protein J6R90_04860 [Alistipes sp.]|nr:hypothetical protein [Alistipes sp.]